MNLLNKSILLVSFILGTSTTYAAQLSCGGDYRLDINGPTFGNSHSDVVRAGVVLVKDYGQDEPNKPGSRYAVILGHDANADFWNFQAGKCEQNHQYTSETAQDELREETGSAIKIGSRQIGQQPYIYSGQKQLFFVGDDTISVNDIKKACLAARANLNLPACQREIDNITAVSLVDLLSLADTIQKNNLKQKQYLTYSRTKNIPVSIEGYYMRMIANKLPEVRLILNNLFPGAQF